MKPLSLRKTTLLSLLGLSATATTADATTSSWGEPFSVQGPTSTENLVASSVLASSAASVAESEISSALVADSSFTVTLPSATQSGLTISTSLSAASGSASVTTTGTGSAAASGPTGSGTAVQSVPDAQTGAAAPTPYVKMGVVGVLAGAAGVLMV